MLLGGAALTVLAMPLSALAQAVIDNGDVETVKGDGSGTQPSPWDTSSDTLVVGDIGTGSLMVESGGSLISDATNIGLSAGSTGVVTIDGGGTNWTNTGHLYVGVDGHGTLNITNGASVTSENWNLSIIGYNVGGVGSVTVDGEGSSWVNRYELFVGDIGEGSLTVSNGGLVSTNRLQVIGQGTSTVNIGSATGATATGAGTIDTPLLNFVQSGTLVFNHTDTGYSFAPSIEGYGTLNHYAGETILTGANTYTGATRIYGGTLVVGDGGTIAGTSAITIAPDAGNVAGLIVRADNGGGSVSTPGNIAVGLYGTGSMEIASGGNVSSYGGDIGSYAGSDGAVTVVGPGSTWTNTVALTVGSVGTGSLTIADGGSVTDTAGYIGNGLDGIGTVLVDGEGSSWTNAQDLFVGYSGTGSVTITSGASISNRNGYIARLANATGSVSVDGAGSSWTNNGVLYVGVFNDGSLEITNAGSVSSTGGALGYGAYSKGTVLVDGEGSNWAISGDLLVGRTGRGSLTIANGGVVSANAVTLAALQYSYGTVNIGAAPDETATGAGVLDTPALAFGAGGGASGGRIAFNHTDAGYVFAPSISGHGDLVHYAGETILTGANTFTGETILGGGTLVVGDGGTINGTTVIMIGAEYQKSASMIVRADNGGGTVYLPGDESDFDEQTGSGSGYVMVGYAGPGDLAITDGGSLEGYFGLIGIDAEGAVTVDGAGSNWTNRDYLQVGRGEAGSLTISNGGTVNNGGDGLISSLVAATVTVDGAGSSMTNGGNLFVAEFGRGSLTISNGASVTSNTGGIGIGSESQGTVTIDGAGSNWASANEIYVGLEGKADLAITNGARLASELGVIANGDGSSGSVTIDGDGSIWTNTNSLTVGSIGNGSLTIANGGAVLAPSLLIADQIGSVGAVNIGAAAGDAAVAPGTLDAPVIAFGAGAGTLVFNHTDTAYSFDPAISGAGTIQHLAGLTRLATDNSGFTGVTNVTGGTLNIAGSIGGTMNVSGDGRLVGTGTVGSLDLGEGGTVAPGNSIGTISLSGDVTFGTGSVYEVEVDPSSNASDLIAVAGTATLGGGTVTHIGLVGDYSPDSTYTILTAEGGVTGQFAGTISDFAFLNPVLGYTTNAVTLTLSRNSVAFGDIGETYNQRQTAGGVEDLGFGNPVYDAIVVLNAGEARAALDSLSGEVHASVRAGVVDDLRLIRQVVIDQMVHGDSGPAIWGELLGSWSNFDRTVGTAHVDKDMTGIVGGVQFVPAENAVIGIATAYTDSDLEQEQRLSAADVQSFHVLGHFSMRAGAFKLRAGAGYLHSNMETRRQVSFAGFDEMLSAKYDGDTLHTFAELGYETPVGGGTVEPFARITVVRFDVDDFFEAGGTAALSGAGGANISSAGMIGGHFATPRRAPLRLEGTFGLQHVFSGYRNAADLGFGEGLPFNIRGASVSRDSGIFDLSAALGLSGAAEANIAYLGLIGGSGDSQAITAGLSVRF